jgi:hypothetical protein
LLTSITVKPPSSTACSDSVVSISIKSAQWIQINSKDKKVSPFYRNALTSIMMAIKSTLWTHLAIWISEAKSKESWVWLMVSA